MFQMIRYVAAILILLGLMNSARALPWFQKPKDLAKPSAEQTQFIKSTQNYPINFSGVWTGQCDNNPAVDLVIKHENNNFSISYGFMEERYVLGEVKSEVRSLSAAVENTSTTVRWNNDNTALIFINNNLFTSNANQLNVFFSKVSMTLEEGRLVVTGHHYQTNGTSGDFNQETMLCSYQKK
jgi:hypothetical protein